VAACIWSTDMLCVKITLELAVYSARWHAMHNILGSLLCFLLTMAATLQYVVLAERTGSIDKEPLIHAGAVKMVTTRKFSKLDPIIISTKADATLLQMIISIQPLLIGYKLLLNPPQIKAKFTTKQA
jgi:hypothetical protein